MAAGPGPLTRAETDALMRRRRGRNVALLIALLALAIVFYAIAVVKLAHPLSHG